MIIFDICKFYELITNSIGSYLMFLALVVIFYIFLGGLIRIFFINLTTTLASLNKSK